MITKNTRYAILLGLVPIAIFVVAFHSITNFYVNSVKASKIDAYVDYLNQRSAYLDGAIVKQIAQLDFTCSDSDVRTLRDPRFYNRYIRFIAMTTEGGKTCSTVGSEVSRPSSSERFQMDENFFASLILPQQNDQIEWMVIYDNEHVEVFWVLDNSWVNEVIKTPCKDCLFVEFKYDEPIFGDLTISRGKANIAGEENALSKEFFFSGESQANMLIKIYSGEKLKNYAQERVLLWGGLVSVFAGLVTAFSYISGKSLRKSITGLIENGISNAEFIPYYQAIVDSRDGKTVGYEALIRWSRRDGMVPPNMFIGAAEESGLIIPMTNQLIRKIIQDLSDLPEHTWVSINIVSSHLESGVLTKLLSELNWPISNRIHFELTERIPVKDTEAAKKEILYLTNKGYKFKIDDFGTGYGGFSYLQDLGIRCVKVDKMFIDPIGSDDQKLKVLDSIVSAANKAECEMIAEGVESQAQVEYLAQHAIYLIQGYVYAKPEPLTNLASA
ncbi:EAL domain-containing protein [Vibrio alginolyticus]|uniref:EAL domain-containing protein n=1 Tax=Vibrio alginolyticus TaxID=663 RepID=UPI003755160D